jgi:glycosyltransferase involved in cell wall biosynthesis
MKIVYLSPSAQLGGVENVLLDMLACVRQARPAWTLEVIVPAEGPLVERVRAMGASVTVLPYPAALARFGDAGAGGPAGRTQSRARFAQRALLSAPAALVYALRLRRALCTSAPDIVHANGFKMQALAALARVRQASLVWHLHDYVGSRPVAARLLRWLSGACDAAVANSQSVADDAREVFGARVPVSHIYNAVDLKRFAPEGACADLDALSALPPAEDGTVRVGLVATLARWKGHEIFLRALALLPKDLNVRGYVVGDALYQTDGSQHTLDELRRTASELGLNERVGFTGFVPDAAAAMRALDVVVHASTEPEPFGLVIAEAFACARAVIASARGGAAELFTPDVDALAHTPGDPEDLAAHIAQLARDTDLRRCLGARAQAAATRRFDRARLAYEWTKIYCGLRNAEAEADGETERRYDVEKEAALSNISLPRPETLARACQEQEAALSNVSQSSSLPVSPS